jgi:hypothetical protein
MSGGGTTQSTQQQQTTQLPPWINDAAQQNYSFAQNVANQPLQQYQGQMVADVGPQMQQAWNTAAAGGNAGQDQYNAAQAGYLGVMGQQPMQVSGGAPTQQINTNAPGMQVRGAQVTDPGNANQITAAQLGGMNLSNYMNPYTQSVINATLPIMQQANALNQNQLANAANSSNAFGGSRQGVQQGVAQAQGAQNIGQMAAQLNQANFAQAQAAGEFDVGQQNQIATQNQNSQQTDLARAMQGNLANQASTNQANLANQALGMQGQLANQSANAGDLNRWLAAAQGNQSAQQNQAGMNLQAAGGLGALGNAAQANQIKNFGEQVTAGSLQQQQAQNQINAQMAKFQQAWAYPGQQLGVLQSALGQTPYGQSQTGTGQTQTQTSPDYAMSALGGLQTLGSLFSAPAGGVSAMSGMSNFFGSDRRLKTDIKKVGAHPAGVPIYAYRYKGDPKRYPKVVGPMAEDVAKIAPHAVAPIPGSGGKMSVHMGVLGALGAGGGMPPSRPRGVSLPTPDLRALASGPLAAPVPINGVGALGANMGVAGGPRARRPRMPQIRGALGG